MASKPPRYQLPANPSFTYTGNALTTMLQPNISFVLGGSGTGTALSVAYPGGSSATPTAYPDASGMPFMASYALTPLRTFVSENVINYNTTINTNEPAADSYILFTTNGNMVSSFNVLPQNTISTFSSLAKLQAGSYVELQQALTELSNLDDDDDWKIQTPVYCASLQVAAALFENNIPKPGVFTHGQKSVVFNWSGRDLDLYLTVTKSRLSVLVSSTEDVEYRTEFSADSGDDTNRFFSALSSTHLIWCPVSSTPPEGPALSAAGSDK